MIVRYRRGQASWRAGPKRGFDFRYVFDRITNGYPPMPAFNRLYTPEQVWKIVAFVQS